MSHASFIKLFVFCYSTTLDYETVQLHLGFLNHGKGHIKKMKLAYKDIHFTNFADF